MGTDQRLRLDAELEDGLISATLFHERLGQNIRYEAFSYLLGRCRRLGRDPPRRATLLGDFYPTCRSVCTTIRRRSVGFYASTIFGCIDFPFPLSFLLTMIHKISSQSMGVTERCKVSSIPLVWFLVVYLQLQRSFLNHNPKYYIKTHPSKSFPADGLGIFHSSEKRRERLKCSHSEYICILLLQNAHFIPSRRLRHRGSCLICADRSNLVFLFSSLAYLQQRLCSSSYRVAIPFRPLWV